MKVIIVGCGRLGIVLTQRLLQKHYDITVVDSVKASFTHLPPDFEGQTVEGDALNQDVLLRAGIDKADALVAVTNCDPLNATVAHIARTIFNVPHVIVRNFDPKWRDLHETFGFQVISSTSWGAQRIEEMIENADVRMVYSAGNGEVEIYEFEVPASFAGKTLSIITSDECIPVAISRAGKAMMPKPDMLFEKDDLVQISATDTGAKMVHDLLAKA
jgi:trk system potassium uptake protein